MSAVKRLVLPALFWIWKAAVLSVAGLTSTPVLPPPPGVMFIAFEPVEVRPKVVPEVRAIVLADCMATAPPEPVLPILVAPLPVALMLAVPPVIVRPALPVRRPALVIVPVLVVEMLPEVVTLSPAVAGWRVMPLRLQ